MCLIHRKVETNRVFNVFGRILYGYIHIVYIEVNYRYIYIYIYNHKWVKDLISSASSFTQAIAKSDLIIIIIIIINIYRIHMWKTIFDCITIEINNMHE